MLLYRWHLNQVFGGGGGAAAKVTLKIDLSLALSRLKGGRFEGGQARRALATNVW